MDNQFSTSLNRARGLPIAAFAAFALSVALAGCATTSNGQGTPIAPEPPRPEPPPVMSEPPILSSAPSKARLEVRSYVLARDGAIPGDARAYAVIAFRRAAEAERFCPAFRARLDFEGALVSNTDLTVTSRGMPVEIAPMVWPVTSWGPGDRPDCATLVARYDFAGARAFLAEARRSLAPLGLSAEFNSAAGPYIISARRSGSLTVYDLSRAPDADYDRWLVRTVDGIEAGVTGPAVVAPGWRDQMRFYAFSAVPSIEAALDVFVPGYAKARGGS